VVEGDVKLTFFYCFYFPHSLLFASYDHCWLLISTAPTISCGVQLDAFFVVWPCLWMDGFNGPYQTSGQGGR
jgi:hypothetical protein